MKAVHLLLAVTVTVVALDAHAQGMSTSPGATANGNVPFVNAEVQEVDGASGLVTLKHEDIPNLNMPGMTMPFPVVDRNLLKDLKAGDKVRVQVEQVKGTFTVTAVERGK